MRKLLIDIQLRNRCLYCGRFWNPLKPPFKLHCKGAVIAYEKSKRELDKKLKPLTDAIRDSKRITADDLKIMVY